MSVTNTDLQKAREKVLTAPVTPIPTGLNRIPDVRAWSPRDNALLQALAFIQDLQTQLSAFTASVGLSTSWAAGAAVAAGGGVASFELPIPRTLVNVNALTFSVLQIVPGPSISSFDVALYDTEANRNAGTFSTADPGLQLLGPALATAAAGSATARWAVLGLMQGSLQGTTPVLWGLVRNNDALSVFDGTVAVEAYGYPGTRAV